MSTGYANGKICYIDSSARLFICKSVVEGAGELLADLVESPDVGVVSEDLFYTGVQFGGAWGLVGAEEGLELLQSVGLAFEEV